MKKPAVSILVKTFDWIKSISLLELKCKQSSGQCLSPDAAR